MAKDLIFKECKKGELELLSRISRETFSVAFKDQNNPDDFKTYLDTAFSHETLTRELQRPESRFYFVYRNTALVAYFKLNTGNAQTDIYEDSGMELERIYVLKEFQGLGIGSEILFRVKKMAIAEDKQYLWLGVWEENRDAIRFYEKQGFVKSGMHPYYIGNDKQMDWVMKADFHNIKFR